MNPHTPNFTRRTALGIGASAAVLLGTGAWSADAATVRHRMGNPFTLGLASGDPTPDGVVLWTRLAPDPFAADGKGGMGQAPIRVDYQVATDESFRRVVRDGSVLATAHLAHSVHPEIHGLQPGRDYWYRFRAAGHLSETGRTRTAPPAHAMIDKLTFAHASCQAWQDGYYTAYDHLAEEDLDFVLHLGDYIYESGLKTNKRNVTLPSQFDDETVTLPRYRLQYALYKSERPLQAAHAAFPWITVFDDHEVENNWAGETPEESDPATRQQFLRRRAAAFQAMYEHQPLRRAQLPHGPNVHAHRRLSFGRLVDLTVLDTRQFRDDQPCGDGHSATCTDRFDTDRTILGARQRNWLLDGFSTSRARWQVIGNQVAMGETDIDADPKVTDVYLDPWDGYVADRNRVLAAAQDRGVRNLVVVTGDRHINHAIDLKLDYTDEKSPTVGSEFVGTSITSGADGADLDDLGRTILAANPWFSFYNRQRGYSRATVTRDEFRNDFRVVPYVLKEGAPITTRASLVVQDRRPGIVAG